eukprot:CAMPEP_0117580262 /NCGR_PEP_ID=MMETSP0784-20121206/65097_1 /TAXON_ID=39447 /ORGANISM="" /LENGTH=46 /DNA_ID= /DNA_START= /DNA_END= /DNA_ORIENTATION=
MGMRRILGRSMTSVAFASRRWPYDMPYGHAAHPRPLVFELWLPLRR